MPLKKKLKSQNHQEEEEEEQVTQEESSDESFDDEDDDETMSDEDDDDESGEDDEFDPNEEIMIDFEARNLVESDHDSVKLMIQQKLGQFNQINLSELAKIVVQQESIGNAIYQAIENEDEDENEEKEENTDEQTIFGALSMVDLSSPRTKNFSSNFIQWLKSQADSKTAEKLNDLLKNKNVSYIVNERYINIPPGISVPMFESLLKDLDSLAADSPNKNSDYWLFIAKYFEEEQSKSKSSKASNEPELIYANPEEEVFAEFSEFTFPISYGAKSSKASSGKWSKDDPTLSPSLNVLILPRNKVSDALAKIKTLIK